MQIKKKYLSEMCSLLLAVSLAIPQTLPAVAAEKPETMENIEWEQLTDNVLEYNELENRVAYFNPTICQIVDQINDSFDTVRENILDFQQEVRQIVIPLCSIAFRIGVRLVPVGDGRVPAKSHAIAPGGRVQTAVNHWLIVDRKHHAIFLIAEQIAEIRDGGPAYGVDFR